MSEHELRSIEEIQKMVDFLESKLNEMDEATSHHALGQIYALEWVLKKHS